LKKEFPYFSVGFIASILKILPLPVQEEYFREIYQLKWDDLIGVDFVN